MGEACPFCEGRGIIKSKITVAYEIMRQLEKLAAGKKNAAFLIEAHHEIISLLLNNEKEAIEYIESFYHVSIKTAANESVLYDRYKIKIVGYI